MEKRGSDRVSFQTTAEIRHPGGSTGGMVDNISLKGLYTSTNQPIPVGTEVRVVIKLSGSEENLSVEVMGTVSRSDAQGTAVSFSEIELDNYVLLRNIVRYASPDGEQKSSE